MDVNEELKFSRGCQEGVGLIGVKCGCERNVGGRG